MIQVPSEIEGKKAYYGQIKEGFEQEGFVLGGNWEYDGGFFDRALSRHEGETVYLRIPFNVLSGIMDEDIANIQFGTPFVVKHVVHTGMEEDVVQHPGLDQTGLSPMWNQFQKPVTTDGDLLDQEKWVEKAKEVLKRLEKHLH